jgi:hypothetical protein
MLDPALRKKARAATISIATLIFRSSYHYSPYVALAAGI